MNQTLDVVICGAGPAGSTCALALGKSGLRVALVDKSTFPRDKICGDAVAAYVPKVLSTIDPIYAEAFLKFSKKEVVNTLRVVAPNTKAVDLKFPVNGAIIMRENLDIFLVEQALQLPNVTPYFGQGVNNVQTDAEQAIVTLENGTILTAKLVIGCDGAQGIVSKKLTNNKIDLLHNSAAVRAYYKNVSGIPEHTFELHYIKNLMPGYFWIFPLPNGEANVGLGLLSQKVKDNKINLREEFSNVINNNPYLKERFVNAEMISPLKGFGLPLGSRKITISGHRFMLCGDAASLIDPLSGEGIGQAMVSGRYAGWQAIKCFEKNDFSETIMLDYRKTVYDKLWKEHRLHYWTQKAINNRPWVVNSFANIALKNQFTMKLFQKMFW